VMFSQSVSGFDQSTMGTSFAGPRWVRPSPVISARGVPQALSRAAEGRSV
jgi:hypothetical protein